MLSIWAMAVLTGLFAGFIRAIVGYCRNAKEGFVLEKFGKTLVLSMVIGFVTAIFITQNLAMIFAVTFVSDVTIEDVLKGFIKGYKK